VDEERAGREPLQEDDGGRERVGLFDRTRHLEDEPDPPVETHAYDPETEARQIAGLNRVRAGRDARKLDELLRKLRQVAEDEDANIMPVTIELVKAGASMGDIVEALRDLWGSYRETPVI